MSIIEIEHAIRKIAYDNQKELVDALADQFEFEYDPADMQQYLALAKRDGSDDTDAPYVYAFQWAATPEAAITILTNARINDGWVPCMVWDTLLGISWPVRYHRTGFVQLDREPIRDEVRGSRFPLSDRGFREPPAAQAPLPLHRDLAHERLVKILDRVGAGGYDVDVIVDNAVEEYRRTIDQRRAAKAEGASVDA